VALNSVERMEIEEVGRSPMDQPHPVRPSLRITLWPNPVNTHFIASAELGADEDWEIILHNPTGDRVWSASGYSDRVRILACPARGLVSGVYFLSLRTETRQTTTPVTVLK
jgi:hypothetical protein